MKTLVNWYELADNQILYLQRTIVTGLLEKGIKTAGSLSKLCIAMNSKHYYTLSRKHSGFSVKQLKKLLSFIEVNYDFVSPYIVEVRKGTIPSISQPRFPINMADPRMGYLLGHLASDGCLYYDRSRTNLIRTKYCSDEQEAIDLFIGDLYSIFGRTHFDKELVRNCIQIRIGNKFVGETFQKAGAIVGKKYKINSGLPWLVHEGGKELQRNYLSAIFDDEGSVGTNRFPYVTLSRNIHIKLTPADRRFLIKEVVPLMKRNRFSTGHHSMRISIGELRQLLVKRDCKLLNKVLASKPKLLLEESELLTHTFGIENSTYVMSLQLTEKGNFSVQTCMVIRNKASVKKFYVDIGFLLAKKQKKLKDTLISKNWL